MYTNGNFLAALINSLTAPHLHAHTQVQYLAEHKYIHNDSAQASHFSTPRWARDRHLCDPCSHLESGRLEARVQTRGHNYPRNRINPRYTLIHETVRQLQWDREVDESRSSSHLPGKLIWIICRSLHSHTWLTGLTVRFKRRVKSNSVIIYWRSRMTFLLL